MNRPKTYLAFGLLLVLTASRCLADEKEELKDILGSGSEQKTEVQASTPALVTPNSNSSNVNNGGNQKKLNIVVSSIHDDGVVKEAAGQVDGGVSVEQAGPPAEDKSQPKNNHVRLRYL